MTSTADARVVLVDRLATREARRSEATIQADVRSLLLDVELGLAEGDLEVNLEAQVGDGRRIDVEVGCTVIEVKRDLQAQAVVVQATTQLAGYVMTRAEQTGQRYVGVLTDGSIWIAFHEVDGSLHEERPRLSTGGPDGRRRFSRLVAVAAARLDRFATKPRQGA